MSTDGPASQERLPDDLVKSIDSLAATELRAVRAYVEHRLEEIRTPITERVLAEAAGEVVDIEDDGAFTLVRMLPPSLGDSHDGPRRLGLYRVKHEKWIDGEESLHWSFLGYVSDSPDLRCENCGATLNESSQSCPDCGYENANSDFRGKNNG